MKMQFAPATEADVSKRFSDLCILSPDNKVFTRAKKVHHDLTPMERSLELPRQAEEKFGVHPVAEIIRKASGSGAAFGKKRAELLFVAAENTCKLGLVSLGDEAVIQTAVSMPKLETFLCSASQKNWPPVSVLIPGNGSLVSFVALKIECPNAARAMYGQCSVWPLTTVSMAREKSRPAIQY